jgi:hypothetical protein
MIARGAAWYFPTKTLVMVRWVSNCYARQQVTRLFAEVIVPYYFTPTETRPPTTEKAACA